MKIGARVELIKRLSRSLAESSWPEIDLVLRQAKLSTTDQWESDDRYSYCIWALEPASDDILTELDDYLHSTTHTASAEEPWQLDQFRIFITHVAARKAEAAALKDELVQFGIDGFVAHQDIEPAKSWQKVIEAALLSCDALVALLHHGFRESSWCDQEVGYVLGRNVPVIPVACDLQPYGFFGALQSLDGRPPAEPMEISLRIARLLLVDTRTGPSLTDRIVRALIRSQHWRQSNILAPLLAEYAPLITKEQVIDLREAQKSNIEVGEAFQVEPSLNRIVKRFGLSETIDPLREYSDEAPF